MNAIAIQVIPIFDLFTPAGVLTTPQFDGPDGFTTGWSIYFRKEDGTVVWFADSGSEESAMYIAHLVAVDNGVEIEPQPWKKNA